jgi:hypothetical protein
VLTNVRTDRSPRHEATVSCRDIAGRCREVVVASLSDERVMVTVPAGEVADLEPDDADRLWTTLQRFAPTHPMFEVAPTVSVWGSFSDTLRCSDALDRPRGLTVTTRRVQDRVSLIAPAGAIAVLRRLGVAQAGTALRAAVRAIRVEAVIA